MSGSRVVSLLVVASWLALGCGSSKKIAVGTDCLLNSDCNSPLSCSFGKCHDTCKTSRDCPTGESCVKTTSGAVCQLPTDADCQSTGVCNGGLVCAADLRCRASCQATTDCLTGQSCASGVCADSIDLDANGQLVQTGVASSACVLKSDCNSSLTCILNRCHYSCQNTSVCPAGQSCVETATGAVCQLPVEATCDSSNPCNGDLVCAVDYRCRASCKSASDCTTGQTCVVGVCADSTDLNATGQLTPQSPPKADSGVDAPAIDAIAPDTNLGVGGAVDVGGPISTGGAGGTRDSGAISSGGATGTLDGGTPDTASVKPADTAVTPDAADAPVTSDVPADLADTSAIDSPGASPVPMGCGVASSTTRYFCDDFESGLSNWVVSGQDWGLTTEQSRSTGHSATDTPGGQITTGENAAITMMTSLDLTAAVAPVLVFWDKRTAGSNSTYVEASSDGGTTWSQLASWGSAADHSTWLMQQQSLLTFVGKKVKIRFRLAQYYTGVYDGWYIDDVEIRETWPVAAPRASATGCNAMPAAVSTQYFCDDFESGVSKWLVSGYDWNTTAIEARSGISCVTDTPDGSIASGENAAITMMTSLDLTGAVAPVLVFWDKRAAGSNSTYVEASSDGGTTWSQLAAWGSTADHTTWLMQQQSLSAFVGKKVKIRFRLAQYYSGAYDGWYIDDVEIREAN